MWEVSTSCHLFIEYAIITTARNEDKLVELFKNNNLPLDVNIVHQLDDLYFPKEKKENKKNNFVFKYDVLYPLIYSAFIEKYNIDLCLNDIHFKKFQILLNNLTGTYLNDVLQAWSKDLKGIKGKELQYYKDIKERYPLGNSTELLTAEERNQSMKDYISKRFEEVEQNGG